MQQSAPNPLKQSCNVNNRQRHRHAQTLKAIPEKKPTRVTPEPKRKTDGKSCLKPKCSETPRQSLSVRSSSFDVSSGTEELLYKLHKLLRLYRGYQGTAEPNVTMLPGQGAAGMQVISVIQFWAAAPPPLVDASGVRLLVRILQKRTCPRFKVGNLATHEVGGTITQN